FRWRQGRRPGRDVPRRVSTTTAPKDDWGILIYTRIWLRGRLEGEKCEESARRAVVLTASLSTDLNKRGRSGYIAQLNFSRALRPIVEASTAPFFSNTSVRQRAYDPTASPPRPHEQEAEDEVGGPAAEPAEARGLHARLHDDAQEAELGAPQGGQGAPGQRRRGHRLHPRRGPQPAGALDRAGARRSCEGPAGREVPHRARRARRLGRAGPPQEPLEVRHEAAEGRRRRCGEEEVSAPRCRRRPAGWPGRRATPTLCASTASFLDFERASRPPPR